MFSLWQIWVEWVIEWNYANGSRIYMIVNTWLTTCWYGRFTASVAWQSQCHGYMYGYILFLRNVTCQALVRSILIPYLEVHESDEIYMPTGYFMIDY